MYKGHKMFVLFLGRLLFNCSAYPLNIFVAYVHNWMLKHFMQDVNSADYYYQWILDLCNGIVKWLVGGVAQW